MTYGAPSGRIANKPGSSYQYRTLCDSCGLKYWNYELRLRWDGLWCCPDDWEIRHPLDFYRTRNDTHKLPYIRSDTPADPALTYTPTVTTVIAIKNKGNEVGTQNTVAYYIQNPLDLGNGNTAGFSFGWESNQTGTFINGSTTVYFPIVTFAVPTFSNSSQYEPAQNPQSYTTGITGTISLPTTPTVRGSGLLMTSYGVVLRRITFAAGNSTPTLAFWPVASPGLGNSVGNLIFTAYYGT